jgi:hypothetical protein
VKDSRIVFVWVAVFAAAFAYVESSIVVYLRAIYYPEGFTFPLEPIRENHLRVEVIREVATLVMLASAGLIAGRTRWQRFSYFAIAFGVWDIFYYIWLKAILDWPSSLFEWDVLFLVPLPWIGPVIAPIAISVLLIVTGSLIISREAGGLEFHPQKISWVLAAIGSVVIILSFMLDTDATLRFALPQPYRYDLFGAGVICYLAGMYWMFWRKRGGTTRTGY